MKKQLFDAGVFAVLLGVSVSLVGCGQKAEPNAADKGTPTTGAKAGTGDDSKPRVLETVDLVPGKPISPQDQEKISSFGLKLLGHVTKAQQDIQAKNIDGAKTELAQAGKLLDIIKEMLPTVKVIDHIWMTRTDLSYLNTTEVRQDFVTVAASVDRLYDILPEGKAKEHAKQAKTVLSKEKEKGAPKAREELEAVEESLDFREVDLSVSYTSRELQAAREDLDKGKTKEAGDALKAVSDGLVFVTAVVVDPLDEAVRRIWLAGKDYAHKDYKTAKTRLVKAKTALQDVAQNGDKSLQAGAKDLIGKIDAIDVGKAEDKTTAALAALQQDARKLIERSPTKGKEQSATGAKSADQTFVQAADQIDLAEVKLGKVAEDHAASGVVKKFGERSTHDHALMNKELREIMSKKGMKFAEQLDPKHQELLDQLSKLNGVEFDRVFTKDMVSGHQKAIELFETEAKSGQDSEVKAWAAKWLPTLREHLKLAQAAVEDVKKK